MKKTLQTLTLIAAIGLSAGSLHAASSFGVSFNSDAAVNVTNAFGTTAWTNTTSATGNTLNTTESGVQIAYSTANFWGAGAWSNDGGTYSDTAVNIFNKYLDDGDAVSGSAPAALGTQTGSDGYGAVFQLTGLSAWLTANGATSYKVTIFRSTDSGTSFTGVTAFDGNLQGANLGTATATVLGNGAWDGYMVNTGNTTGIRGENIFNTLSANTLTLAAGSGAGSGIRGGVAGVLITVNAVPEPSTYGLVGAGALAAVAFVRRRRRAQA